MTYNTLSPFVVFKYCPRCRSEKFAPKSNKALHCENCNFIYYVNMSAATAVLIFNDQQQLLLTTRGRAPAKGLLDLPGGFIDLGETAEDAIRREVKEELNIELENLTYFGTFPNKYLFSDVMYQTLDIVFKATVKSFDSIKANDDVTGFCFRNPLQVKEDEIGLESIKLILRKLQQNNY